MIAFNVSPNHVKVMHSVDAMERRNVKVNKAYIVSCTNSRVQDLSAAAKVLRVFIKIIFNHVYCFATLILLNAGKESSRRG